MCDALVLKLEQLLLSVKWVLEVVAALESQLGSAVGQWTGEIGAFVFPQ